MQSADGGELKASQQVIRILLIDVTYQVDA